MHLVLAILVAAAAVYTLWRIRYGPRRPGARVLCFHKVTRRFCAEGTWTTPRRFEAALDAVERAGYRWIDESTWFEGRGAGRAVWLTFDDAYEEVYHLAFPILRRRNIPFHLFVVSGYAGEDNTWELGLGRRPHRHAGWEQIAEMVSAGATVGSHTVSHADLTRVSPSGLHAELSDSKHCIESRLGVGVRTLSYPFGRADRRVRLAAAAAGYDAAFSIYPRRRNDEHDEMAIRRDAVYVIDPAWLVPLKLGGGVVSAFEEMKCRAIHSVAALTPLFKRRRAPAPDS